MEVLFMSRSTKWMKKGFAWLLCLIMLTGMLSSAASAGGPQPQWLKINYGGMFPTTMAWTDGNGTAPSIQFSAEFDRNAHTTTNGTFSFEWYYKSQSGDKKVFDQADTVSVEITNTYSYYDWSWSASAKSGNYDKGIDALYAKCKAGTYYCVVTFTYYMYSNYGYNTTKKTETVKSEDVTITKYNRVVFLDSNDGTVDTVDVVDGGKIAADQMPTAPTVEGSEFTGWVNTKTNAKLTADTEITEPSTYKATYEKNIVVTFIHKHDDMPPFTGTLNDEGKVEVPDTPVKCGNGKGSHTFVGWFKDESLETPFSFDTVITDSVNIYGAWGYVVKFNPGKGAKAIDPVKVIQDRALTDDDLPTPEDPEGKFEFVGWKIGGVAYNGQAITKDTTLVGDWKKKTKTISLQAEDSYVYNGKSQGVKIVDANGKEIEIPANAYTLTYKKGNQTISAQNVKDAGTYTATLALKPSANDYQIAEGGNQVTFTIQKKTITSITWTGTELEYNAKEQKPSAKAEGLIGNDKCELTVSGGQTNAGQDYTATAAISAQNGNSNYVLDNEKTGNVTTKFSIAKKPLTVTWGNTTLEYNDNDQAPTEKVEGFVESDLRAQLVSYSVSGQAKEIGEEHVASVVLAGERAENYVIPENATIKFNIVKIQPELSLSGYKSTVEYGGEFAFSYTLKKNSIYSVVSVEFSKEGVASAVINTTNKTIKITGTGVCNEPITVTVKVMETTHHKEVTASFNLEVTKRIIELDWKGKEFTYDGEEHCPTATVKTVLVNGDKVEDLGLTISGAKTDAGENYTANAKISSDKYELAKKSENYTFKINKATVTINAENVNLTYGDKDFDFVYSVTGVDINKVKVTVYNPWGKEVVRLKNGKLYTVNAGDAQIVLSYEGDNNHEKKEKTIAVHVSAKEVTIKWENTSFKYDKKSHVPTATIEGLVEGDDIKAVVYVDYVYGYPSEVGKYTARASLPWNTKNYTIKNGYGTCSFEIYRVADDKLTFEGKIVKEYFITATNPNPKLDLNGLKYVISYNDGFTVKHSVKSSMVSGFSLAEADLGEQTITVKVTVDGKELTGSFTVTVMRELTIDWNTEGLVYNGKTQGPSASVAKMNDDDFEKYISIAFEGVNANTVDNPYYAKATLTEEGAKRYVLANNNCEYTIASKPVTITWNFEGAKTEYVDEIIPVYIFFVGHDKIAPTAQLKDTEEDILVLTTKDEEGNPVKDASAAGHYSIEASLSSTNYAFANDSETSVGYSVEVPVVTKIEVLKGYKADYYVGDAFDNENLKIKATLSDDSTQELAAKDNEKIMVTGFDSATEGAKALTVKYEGQTAGFTVEVSKKQSSIGLNYTNNLVNKTYGDDPFSVDFTATNDVVITSSDETVAKIDEKNQVVIVGAGDAVITLKIADTDEVIGSETSFKLDVAAKVVGLSWSTENTFDEDGKTHVPTVKATELVGNDTCEVIVDGATAVAGTHTAKATGLSNKNYQLPENAITTFVINAKEEPKTEEPKTEEPKTEEPKTEEPKVVEPKIEEPKFEEPKKEEPKFTTVITIGTNFKVVYDKGDKFDPTGLTIEVVNEKGEKTVVDVTEDMVKGFDSSKEGDIVITIQYKDASKEVPIKIVSYNTKSFFNPDGSFKSETHRSEHDELTFKKLKGVYINKKLVDPKYYRAWSGSLHLLISADFMKSLPVGENELEILFEDGKSVVSFTVAAPAASDASPVTGDTGNQMMWIILLAAAAVVLVAIRVYAAKRSNAE
jgi:hypothetical protein